MRDLYREITDSIVREVEKGTIPWLRPWRTGVGPSVDTQLPRNAMTNREYSGINVCMLWGAAAKHGYESGRWLTFKQAKEAGGHVRKGEKGELVIFIKKLERKRKIEDGEGEDKIERFPMMRGYTVFNVAQCDDLPEKLLHGKPLPPAPELDTLYRDFVAATTADIRHGGDRAFYSTGGDYIGMPHIQAFKEVASYKATCLHELTHWTGHKARCDRQFGKRFGEKAYAAEELVAEIGAAFLCAHLGVRGELRHASYVANWLEVLKSDKRAIFTAASAASKAADFLRSFSRAGRTCRRGGRVGGSRVMQRSAAPQRAASRCIPHHTRRQR